MVGVKAKQRKLSEREKLEKKELEELRGDDYDAVLVD